MENNLVKYETEHGEITISPEIARTLVSGDGKVSDQEIMMFLHLCQYQKLNPFLRECYLVKYGNAAAQIVTGKEVYTKRAASIPDCSGWEAGVTVIKDGVIERRNGSMIIEGEKLIGGWCKVYRRNWTIPAYVEVSFAEYNSGKATWAKMPATMIRKVAIVTGLRECFPSNFQGMYESAELKIEEPVADVIDVTGGTVYDHDTGEIIDPPKTTTTDTDPIIDAAKVQCLWIYAGQAGRNEAQIHARTQEKYGKAHVSDLTASEWKTICDELKKIIAHNEKTKVSAQ